MGSISISAFHLGYLVSYAGRATAATDSGGDAERDDSTAHRVYFTPAALLEDLPALLALPSTLDNTSLIRTGTHTDGQYPHHDR